MSEGDITDNLIVQVLSSPIGAILSSVSKADQIHIYKRYLQDYVACVYKSMQKDTKIEQKVHSMHLVMCFNHWIYASCIL